MYDECRIVLPRKERNYINFFIKLNTVGKNENLTAKSPKIEKSSARKKSSFSTVERFEHFLKSFLISEGPLLFLIYLLKPCLASFGIRSSMRTQTTYFIL